MHVVDLDARRLDAPLQLRQLLLDHAQRLFARAQRLVRAARRLRRQRKLALDALDLGGIGVRLRHQALDLFARLERTLLEPARLARRVIGLGLAELDAIVELVEPLLQLRQRLGLRRQLEPRGLDLRLARDQSPVRRLARLLRHRLRLGGHALLGDEPEPALRRRPQLDVAQLGLVLLVALGLLRLAPQRAELLLDLGDDVGDAQQVLPRRLHLLLGGLLLHLVLR